MEQGRSFVVVEHDAEQQGSLTATGDSADNELSSQPNPKKRERYTIANLACEMCRTRHRRCDSQQPSCSLCIKTGSACVYPTERRKRGPSKRRAIENATAEGKSTEPTPPPKQKQTPLQQPSSRPNNELTPPLIPPISGLLATPRHALALPDGIDPSAFFVECVQAYEDHVEVFLFVGSSAIPARDYSAFLELTDLKKIAYTTAILSLGARVLGMLSISRALMTQAKAWIRQLSGEKGPFIAATHTIFTFDYTLQGDLNMANQSNSSTFQMASELLRHVKDRDHPSIEGIDIASIYMRCVVVGIETIPHTPSAATREALAILQRLPLPPAVFSSIKQFSEIQATCCDVLTCPLEDVMNYLSKLTQLSSGMSAYLAAKPSLTNRVYIRASRIIPIIHLRVGNKQLALQTSDEMVALIQQLTPEFYDTTPVSCLFCSGQVYARLGITDKLEVVLQLLNKMVEYVPIARRTMARLGQIQMQIDAISRSSPSPQDVIDCLPYHVGFLWEIVDSPQPEYEFIKSVPTTLFEPTTMPTSVSIPIDSAMAATNEIDTTNYALLSTSSRDWEGSFLLSYPDSLGISQSANLNIAPDLSASGAAGETMYNF